MSILLGFLGNLVYATRELVLVGDPRVFSLRVMFLKAWISSRKQSEKASFMFSSIYGSVTNEKHSTVWNVGTALSLLKRMVKQ